MPIDGLSEGVAAHAIWATLVAMARRLAGRQIRITHPRPLEALTEPEPLGSGVSFAVKGTLRHLPKNHELWLLTQDESTGQVWPQGFFTVQFDPHQGTWMGRITGFGMKHLKIIAVVAPPASQDFFRYYEKVIQDKGYPSAPLKRVPPECTNSASVQTHLA